MSEQSFAWWRRLRLSWAAWWWLFKMDHLKPVVHAATRGRVTICTCGRFHEAFYPDDPHAVPCPECCWQTAYFDEDRKCPDCGHEMAECEEPTELLCWRFPFGLELRLWRWGTGYACGWCAAAEPHQPRRGRHLRRGLQQELAGTEDRTEQLPVQGKDSPEGQGI